MSQQSDEAMLKELQQNTFNYFLRYGNEDNGLIADSSRQDSPASITAVGLALGSYPVAVERGFISRQNAMDKTLTTLRFFWHSPQGPKPDATGYKGFYYYCRLDWEWMRAGRPLVSHGWRPEEGFLTRERHRLF